MHAPARRDFSSPTDFVSSQQRSLAARTSLSLLAAGVSELFQYKANAAMPADASPRPWWELSHLSTVRLATTTQALGCKSYPPCLNLSPRLFDCPLLATWLSIAKPACVRRWSSFQTGGGGDAAPISVPSIWTIFVIMMAKIITGHGRRHGDD